MYIPANPRSTKIWRRLETFRTTMESLRGASHHRRFDEKLGDFQENQESWQVCVYVAHSFYCMFGLAI